MPPIIPDDDDPIVASYDVYITAHHHDPLSPARPPSSKLLLLQYPAHRSLARPYNAATAQKPTALRLKPDTGLLEVDIPIITHEHYNGENGARYQNALRESTIRGDGGTHGLAGGFNALHGGPGSQASDLRDIPPHESASDSEPELETQTLGGKIVPQTTRDPVYMLGTFRGSQLHLSPLDALVQVRPQLHHLDAQDEITQRQAQSKVVKARTGSAGESAPAPPPKLESKAIDVKLKDNKDDSKDRSLNTNARLLRNIQHEPWQVYDWTDEADATSHPKFVEVMHLHLPSDEGHATAAPPTTLKSAISNGEWLDKMSAPRETGHGKKGLLAKLRGRERERARRKKNDEERRRRAKEGAAAGGATVPLGSMTAANEGIVGDSESGSDLSNLSGSETEGAAAEDRAKRHGRSKGKGVDVEMVEPVPDEQAIEIKQEPSSSLTAAPAAGPPVPESLEVGAAAPVPKRRGRPRKSQTQSQVDGVVELDGDG